MSVLVHHHGVGFDDLLDWLIVADQSGGPISADTIEVETVDVGLQALIDAYGWYVVVDGDVARLIGVMASPLRRALSEVDYSRGLSVRLEPVVVATAFGHRTQIDYTDPDGVVVVRELAQYWPPPEARTVSVGPVGRLLTMQRLGQSGAVVCETTRWKPYVRLAAPPARVEGETPSIYGDRFALAASVPGAVVNADRSITAGRRRRQAVLDSLTAIIGGVVLGADPDADPSGVGSEFREALGGADAAFLASGSAALIAAVQAASAVTFPWLDALVAPGLTVRAHLVAQLAPWDDSL